MDRTSPEVLREVERVLERKLSTLSNEDYTMAGGIDVVVEVLNNVDRSTEKSIIEALEEEDPELAEEIKKKMFVFEDIVLLDDKAIQKVLRELDNQDLAKALKAVDTEVQEKIFRNMSKRAAALLREDMEFMGPIRLKDVEEAQHMGRERLLKELDTTLMIAFLQGTLRELAGFAAAVPKARRAACFEQIATLCWDALKA